MDTLLCKNKEDAKRAVDNIGGEFIEEFEYLPTGEIKIYMREGWKDGTVVGTDECI